jgi:hypothetical protein
MCLRRIETIHTRARSGKDSGRVRSVYPPLPSRLTPSSSCASTANAMASSLNHLSQTSIVGAKSEQRVSAIRGLTYPDTLKNATL